MGPIMAVQIAESLADERTWELVEKLREKGLRLELDASERRADGRAAGGQDPRPHRHPAGADPRGGGGADQGRRRQGHQLGLEENRLRRRRREPRLEAGQGRGAGGRGPRRSRPAGAPASVAGDRSGDPVLLEVGAAEVADAGHQDREGHHLAAAVEAVAGEVADPGQGAGLDPAAAVGGGAVACGEATVPSRAGQGEVWMKSSPIASPRIASSSSTTWPRARRGSSGSGRSRRRRGRRRRARGRSARPRRRRRRSSRRRRSRRRAASAASRRRSCWSRRWSRRRAA